MTSHPKLQPSHPPRFYYALPDSRRSETRSASGEVTGAYAFVAPEGDEFAFKYTAGEDGFEVGGEA